MQSPKPVDSVVVASGAPPNTPITRARKLVLRREMTPGPNIQYSYSRVNIATRDKNNPSN